MQVAAGNAAGCVTILDISTHRMLAVQRLSCGTGPISCIASYVGQDQRSSIAAADFPRGPDGGGILDDAGILPWRIAGEPGPLDQIGKAKSLRLMELNSKV